MNAVKTAGFTLVEVMVSLAVFMILALGLTSLSRTVLRAVDNNNLRANAAIAANSVEERLLAQLANTAQLQTALQTAATAQTVSINGVAFTTQVVSATGPAGVSLLTAPTTSWGCQLSVVTEVAWHEASGTGRRLTNHSVLVPDGC